MSPCWTVFWMLVTPIPGVLLAAHLALSYDRRKRREDAAKHSAEQRNEATKRSSRLTQVLREGLQRNIVVLRRMRRIAAGDGPAPPASPSLRVDRAHFDATLVSAVELLEAEPEQYGALLTASYAAGHINRRAQVLADLDWMPSGPLPVVGSERDTLKLRHCGELVAHINKALPTFESVLTYLGGEVPGESGAE